jgi:hypothetical protein
LLAIDRLNALYPIGTPCRYWQGTPSRTRTRFEVMGVHSVMVWVEGSPGAIASTHVEFWIMSRHCTLDAIAKLLGGEGFSERSANEVKRYWFRRVPTTSRAQKRLRALKRAFGAMVAEKLDDRDKVLLGKFISVLMRAQFDTGLRLGLMTLGAELGVSSPPDSTTEEALRREG